MPSTYIIDRDQFTKAVIRLNSMSPCDGVMMTRQGEVKVGYRADEETLCELIAAPTLARMLTRDGLSSYTDKELKKWIDGIDIAPLQAIVDEAVSRAGLQ